MRTTIVCTLSWKFAREVCCLSASSVMVTGRYVVYAERGGHHFIDNTEDLMPDSGNSVASVSSILCGS